MPVVDRLRTPSGVLRAPATPGLAITWKLELPAAPCKDSPAPSFIGRMTNKLLTLALLATSSVASAQTYVATDGMSYASEPMYKEIDGRVGFLMGGSDVGDADGFSAGVSAGAGYRMGDVTLRGLFDYYRVGDGASETLTRKGRATRLGGAIRYSFAKTSYESDVRADFWGEIGAGYEHVAWRHGGILDRPSGELAVGFDIARRGDRDRSGRRNKVGMFFDIRSLIAQGPEMDGVMATCGGPCSEATKPSRTDVSIFFELGVQWGH